MKIEPYIAQLLYRYQCVTVPGFGAFLTEIQSAQLNESSNSFYPPKKLVSFNSFLKNNDGLLANHIAQAEKTSYEYAVSAIQYEVFNWKKTLQENGVFAIKNVGDLRLNEDKNLVFTPYDQTNFLASSFGLTPFVSPLVKREIFEQKITAIAEKDPILIVTTEEEKEGEIITIATKKPYTFLKYAAVFVIGLGIAGAVGYPMYENQIVQDTVLVEKSVQKQVQLKIQEATFFISTPLPAVTLPIKEGKMPYHIIAGAFRKERNAQKEMENLIKKGFKAKRIEVNKYGLYPVLYGSYNSLSEAEKEKREIQKTINPDAWILIESL
jgi:CCDC81-like prokaryotic HU domain 2/CCDC81-like prokaryotic HU domain 1/SPOR domain